MDIDTEILIIIVSTIVGVLNGMALMHRYYKVEAKKIATAKQRLKRYIDIDALLFEMIQLKQEIKKLKNEK
jgi:hypothetical protein